MGRGEGSGVSTVTPDEAHPLMDMAHGLILPTSSFTTLVLIVSLSRMGNPRLATMKTPFRRSLITMTINRMMKGIIHTSKSEKKGTNRSRNGWVNFTDRFCQRIKLRRGPKIAKMAVVRTLCATIYLPVAEEDITPMSAKDSAFVVQTVGVMV